MRLQRGKPHAKAFALRAVLGWRDRLRVLWTGRIAVAGTMFADGWMPRLRVETQWLAGQRPVRADTLQGGGFGRAAFDEPDAPSPPSPSSERQG